MKKDRIKWFTLGVVITLIMSTFITPALAATIEATFNAINIYMNGQKVASAGESYTLADGSEVPFSILYKGTTYLPLRKIGEIYDKDILWDGNTSTAQVNNKGYVPPANQQPTQPAQPSTGRASAEEIQQFIELGKNFNTAYDKVDKYYVIIPTWVMELRKLDADSQALGLSPTLGQEVYGIMLIHDNGDISIGIVLTYRGKDGVYFDKVTFSYGDSSETIDVGYFNVARETIRGGIEEYTVIEDKAIEIMRKMANSKDLTIRFRGATKSYDYTPPAGIIRAIGDMVQLYDKLNQYPELASYISESWGR